MKTFVMFVCVFVICVSSAVAVPTITINRVSGWGYPFIEVEGVVTGVDTSLYGVYMSLAPQGVGFWSKPALTGGRTEIAPDGKFLCQYSVGWGDRTDRIASDFAVALYPNSVTVPMNSNTRGIPNYGYAAIGYYERFGTEIDLNGRRFGVKSSSCPTVWDPPNMVAGFAVPVGPNNNYFYPSPNVVVKDSNGYIDLQILGNADQRLCAELVALDHLGYGTYKSVVNVGNIPAGVTVSPGYLFDVFGDLTSSNTNREIDTELGDVAVKNGGTAQFVMQSNNPNIFTAHPFNMTTTGRIQTTISWRPERIDFLMENLDTHESRMWGYTGSYLPTNPGQAQFRINAWVSDEKIWVPTSLTAVEVQSFNYAAGDNGTMVIAVGEVEVLDKISGTGDLIVNGTLMVGSIVQDSLTIGAGGSVIISEVAAQAGEVPEPGIVLLLCSGLVVIFCKRRIKRLK